MGSKSGTYNPHCPPLIDTMHGISFYTHSHFLTTYIQTFMLTSITLIIINSFGVSHRRVKMHGVKMTLRAIIESDVVAVVLAFSLNIELVPDLL